MNRLIMKRLIYDLDLEVAKLKITRNGNSAAAKIKKIIIRMKKELEK